MKLGDYVELTHLSLFTGSGGIDLAAEWAGFKTVGQCEIADYPTMVLEKQFPGVSRWRDIRDVNKKSVRAAGIRAITLISGGFPCQPFSVAGQRRGTADDRHLWPEMFRVISELQPTWVIGENVAGITSMALEHLPAQVESRTLARGQDYDIYEAVLSRQEIMLLDAVCKNLESENYEVQPFIIPACSVDAPHRRYRVLIVAYSQRAEWGKSESAGHESNRETGRWTQEASGPGAPNEDGGAGIVAYRNSMWGLQPQGGIQKLGGRISHGGKDVADTEGESQGGLSVRKGEAQSGFGFGGEDVENAAVGNDRTKIECDKTYRAHPGRPTGGISGSGWRTTQPGLGGNFDGLSARMDQCRWPAGPGEPQYDWEPPRIAQGVRNRKERLKAIGNAVNPYQVYPILKAIAEIEATV